MRTHGVTHWDPDGCYGCRVKTVQLPAYAGPAMQPHFNWTVGEYVTTPHEFTEALKRRGDEMSEQTGYHSEYEARWPGDVKEPPMADTSLLEARDKKIGDLFHA